MCKKIKNNRGTTFADLSEDALRCIIHWLHKNNGQDLLALCKTMRLRTLVVDEATRWMVRTCKIGPHLKELRQVGHKNLNRAADAFICNMYLNERMRQGERFKKALREWCSLDQGVNMQASPEAWTLLHYIFKRDVTYVAPGGSGGLGHHGQIPQHKLSENLQAVLQFALTYLDHRRALVIRLRDVIPALIAVLGPERCRSVLPALVPRNLLPALTEVPDPARCRSDRALVPGDDDSSDKDWPGMSMFTVTFQ